MCGKRAANEDYCALYLGEGDEAARMGVVAALADGVGGTKGGRVAAELAVRSFIDGYYGAPETIGIAAAGRRAMAGFNRWLHALGRFDPALEGAATTFTALVMHERSATVLHVGDSRAWHFRDGQLARLTEDHTLAHPDQRHVLYRAVGIEAELRLDHREQGLALHDRLLLTSDGVHGVLGDKAIAALLANRGSAQADAEAIVAAALAAGSQDNASALVIDVVGLPSEQYDALAALTEALPVEPPPAVGDTVDGFRLDRQLADGRYTRVFVATDEAEDRSVVLKFPKPAILSEEGARTAFTREALVGARVDHPHVGTSLHLAPGRQTRLYIAMPFYDGETLEALLTRAPVSIAKGVRIAGRLAQGVAALHRQGIVHRDIKPDNVLVAADGTLKLIDLGVARLPRVPEFASGEIPGTPSFMAPELFGDERGSPASDQYALGVTLYRLFTDRYPYGEIEPFTRPRFERAVAPSRYRPDLPGWLEALILRAVAVKPGDRFADVIELQQALERGAVHAAPRARPLPLIERYPVGFWKTVSLILFALLVAALATR